MGNKQVRHVEVEVVARVEQKGAAGQEYRRPEVFELGKLEQVQGTGGIFYDCPRATYLSRYPI
jgi:hypothetical protein